MNAKPIFAKRLGITAALLFSVLMIMTAMTAGSAARTIQASTSTVNLGTAGNYVILAESGITNDLSAETSVVGDIAVSPIAATAISNFNLTMDPSGKFATSPMVSGRVYASDYAAPTPVTLTQAVVDFHTAYADAATRISPDYTDEGVSGNIGGLTLLPGLHKWTTGVSIGSNVTINGSSSDVWVFQIPAGLVTVGFTHVILTGGAQAKNIYWQVAGGTTLGPNSVFEGNILCLTAIVFGNRATLHGRALASTAVTLDQNTITAPTTGGGPGDNPGAISGFPVVIFACFLMLGITYSLVSRRKSVKHATA